MSIPQSFIQELIARADIVEIVGRYVQLKKGGANFMGLCPFHGEKSPSFSVSPTKQFYHCFGCGVSGDAIKFLMAHAGMTFTEAVHDLAQQYGLQVPEDDVSPQERARAAEQRQKQVTLSDVLEKAGEAFRKQLRQSPRAIDYFKGRGVTGEVAKRFGLGYAPEGWRSLASVFPHYDDPLLVESGLVILHAEEAGAEEKRYDRFRDRVMFPIRNVKGECIGFGGRVLGDDKPKYLNSPETPVFSKGRELYGLFEARNAVRDAGYVLVTEGYMDVVALAQLGFPNAVATLGTACTADHVQKLFRFTDSVVFSFDGDAAGRRAARKALDGALPYASDVRSVKFLFLPSEHDPDSYIREHGRDAFARYVGEALPLSRFLIEAASEGCDLQSAEGRARLASNARPLWSALPDGALKRQLLGEIAELVQLDSRELGDLWASGTGASRPRRERRSEHRGDDGYAPPMTPPYGDPHEGLPAEAYGYAAPAPAQAGGRPPFRRDGSKFERGGGGGRWPRKGANAQNQGVPGRDGVPSRADHAVRLLLTDMAVWDELSHEDHEMLCGLPDPLGPMMAWLERELHEHGPLPWGSLLEALRGGEFEAAASRLMAAVQPAPASDPSQGQEAQREARQELRGVLDMMLIDRIKQLETEALLAANVGDAQALARYRELQERRREITARVLKTSKSRE